QLGERALRAGVALGDHEVPQLLGRHLGLARDAAVRVIAPGVVAFGLLTVCALLVGLLRLGGLGGLCLAGHTEQLVGPLADLLRGGPAVDAREAFLVALLRVGGEPLGDLGVDGGPVGAVGGRVAGRAVARAVGVLGGQAPG